MKDNSWRAKNFKKARNGKDNPKWKGGVLQRGDGYILMSLGSFPRTYKGKRYDLQHRVVMERHLGRKLKKSEVVHHKNGICSDNRISNLEILVSQSIHAYIHNKTRKRNSLGRFVT